MKDKTIRELQEENKTLIRKLQELSEADRLLEKSSDKCKSLIEANVDMIWETDQEGRLTYVSPQLKKLWNIDPADVLGKKPFDFIPSEDKEMKAAELSSIRSSRQPFNDLLINALDGNGKLVYLEATGSPVFDNNEGFQGYRGIARDITRRTLTERALKESNIIASERLNEIEHLYLNLPIGLCVMDLDLRFLRINEKLAEINGLPVSAHLGKTVAEVLPSLHETAQSILQKILETGVPQMGIEVSGTTSAQPGVMRTWSEDWLPIRDINRKIVSVNVMVVETTEQKKAEREKRKSEERFKIMGEILPYGIWLCDNEGKAVYTSNSFLELLNMTMDEMKGFGWTHRLVPGDAEPMMQKWMHCIKTGEDWDHIHYIIDRHGNIKSVLTRGRPIRDDDGKIYSWAGINLDITERVKAEKEIKLSKEALEKSQEKLQIALDNANIGIWEWDLITGEVRWDEKMESMFGLEPETFGGTRECFESLVHEEDLQHLGAALDKALKN